MLALGYVALAGSVAASVLTDAAVVAKFQQQEAQYQLPSGILGKVARIESGGDARAVASCGGCTASGLFQFTADTWTKITPRLYGHSLPLDERFNPYTSTEVGALYLSMSRSHLGALIQQANLDPIVGIYLGHFLGPGDGKTFLQHLIQDPGAPAAQVLRNAARSNPGRFFANGRPLSFSEVVNQVAAELRRPGITAVTNYAGIYDGSLSDSRIMDAAGRAGLERRYLGAPPPRDPRYDSYDDDFFQAPILPRFDESARCRPQLYCSGNALVRRDASCTEAIVQLCPSGCSGNACAPSQQSPLQQQPFQQLPQSRQPFSSFPQELSGDQRGSRDGGKEPSPGVSPWESLFASRKSDGGATTTATTSSVIIVSIGTAASLSPSDARNVPGAPGESGTGETSGGVAAGTPDSAPSAAAPSFGQQTFTSADLKDTPPAVRIERAPGVVARLLVDLKQALARALDYLASLRITAR